MKFAAAASRLEGARDAAAEVAGEVRRGLGEGEVDLAAVFLTGEHAPDAADVVEEVRAALSPRVLIGCTAESVLGDGDEIEREAGVSLLAARLPGVTLSPFHVPLEDWQGASTEGGAPLSRRIGREPRALFVLGDPFTTPVADMLALFDQAYPGVPVVGGMASAATRPGANVLLLNDYLLEDGVVGLAVSGRVRVDTLVSQGCLPVGQPLRVTEAQGNVIQSLRFRPALEMTHRILSEIPPEEQALLENGLYLGVVTDEYLSEYGRGDFLVRNLIGADPDKGVLVVADEIRPGQTVQFHVRDANTADEDLRVLLEGTRLLGRPAGALLFTCNGRGTQMFDAPCHDVSAVLDALPGLPVAGFFAAGEIGPVGGRSFLHGHTASIALFYPDEVEEENR